MNLTPEACLRWDDFYLDFKAKAAHLEPLTAAATKRIPTYAMKLVLVYAAFEGTAPHINEDQIDAAIQVANFGFECAETLIKSQRPFTVQSRAEEVVLRALKGRNLPVWKIHHVVGGRFSAEDMARAIKALQGTGVIVEKGRSTRGQPTYGLR